MSVVSYVVPNISCEHCVRTIEMELSELQGITRVSANQGNKQVQVEFEDPADEMQIKTLLTEINYPPQNS